MIYALTSNKEAVPKMTWVKIMCSVAAKWRVVKMRQIREKQGVDNTNAQESP
jgi:hypothetical protein